MENKTGAATPMTETPVHPKHHLPKVIIIRDWKDYLGESLLIVFSVLLALFVSEIINKVHENGQTRQLIVDLKAEISENEKKATEQFLYQKKVIATIDSAIAYPKLQQDILQDGRFNLNRIAPYGIVFRTFNDVAWQAARQKDIVSRISLEDLAILTNIYKDQEHINKLDDEMAKIILSYESRNPSNIRQTLLLMRDTYRGWAYDRTPGLIDQLRQEIKKLNDAL